MQRPARASRLLDWKASPRSKGWRWLIKSHSPQIEWKRKNWSGWEGVVWVHKAHISPFPKTVQTHLLEIYSQERNMMLCHLKCWMPICWHRLLALKPIVDVIIDNAETCALLDSRATADLMTLAYAKARNFDIRQMTELSDCFINLRLAARFKTTLSGMSSTIFRSQGSHHMIPIMWPWLLKTILPSARRFPSP